MSAFSRADFLGRLGVLLRDARRLRRLAVKVEELSDSVVQELGALSSDVEAVSKGLAGAAVQARFTQWLASEKTLSALAAKGVSSMTLDPNSDGSAEVVIEDGNPFHLSPLLREVLAILSGDFGANPDEFVGWKSLRQIASRLEERVGRPFRAHAVVNLISRLKMKLEISGSNPQWIQKDGRGNYRFAFHRPGKDAVTR